MGRCDIEHKIITPDGQEFVCTGRIVPGSPDLDWPLGGEGLPQIEHLQQEVYGMPGALYKGVVVKPRLLIFTATMWGNNQKALMQIKARMQGALRWDRADRGDPSIYRITVNGVSRDLYVRYDSSVERRVGRPGLMSIVALRLIAHDPFWYDPVTQEQVLDWEDEFTSRYILAKIDGVWDPMGPPTAAGTVSTIVVDPTTGDVYVGGSFAAWDGLPGVTGNNVVMWDVSAQAWVAIGGGLNGAVHVLYITADGTLYVGGLFTNGSGGAGDGAADYLAQYDPTTDTWVNVGGGPGAGAVTGVYDIVEGHDGALYVIGEFTNWGGLGSPAGDHIVQLPLGGAWATVGNGLNQFGRCGVIAPNGHLVVGGFFGTAGGVACSYIAEWDGTVWSPLGAGTNGTVLDVVYGPDGKLYACGVFTTAGGQTVNYVASFNGVIWSNLDGGLDAQAWKMAMGDDGRLYVVGSFGQAGELTLTDRAAWWNGFAWAHLAFDLPGAPSVRSVTVDGEDLYFGWDAAGTVLVAGDNTVTDAGSVFALPIIEVKNAGLVRSIRNETTGQEIPCDVLILDGEIVTLDLSVGQKTATSNRRGNRLGGILPMSDMGEFCLESAPRAQYGGVHGQNHVSVFITDADPRESGDDNNQLSAWESITGISQGNTDRGRLYVSIVFDGADYHVNLYSDAARTELVGHTADYAAPGAQAIIEDNGSGLGGTITVDAVVGADADIEVWFTIVTMFWRNRWWDLDSAVS